MKILDVYPLNFHQDLAVSINSLIERALLVYSLKWNVQMSKYKTAVTGFYKHMALFSRPVSYN